MGKYLMGGGEILSTIEKPPDHLNFFRSVEIFPLFGESELAEIKFSILSIHSYPLALTLHLAPTCLVYVPS